jgi:hypothetical protein
MLTATQNTHDLDGLRDFYETDLQDGTVAIKAATDRARRAFLRLTYGYLTVVSATLAEAHLEPAFAQIDALGLRSTTR